MPTGCEKGHISHQQYLADEWDVKQTKRQCMYNTTDSPATTTNTDY